MQKINKGITGQEAVVFLLKQGGGEIPKALYHHEIGYIDLVYGERGEKGYGLIHIFEKHPDIIPNLSHHIEHSTILKKDTDRVILMSRDNIQRSVIDLQFNNKAKSWLVTAYRIL